MGGQGEVLLLTPKFMCNCMTDFVSWGVESLRNVEQDVVIFDQRMHNSRALAWFKMTFFAVFWYFSV
jgi:hypothetical protein